MLIEVKNDIQEVARVGNQVQWFCAENGISDDICHDITLILDELITNIVCYAYPDDDEHIFTLDIQLERPTIHIKLMDDGIEFDPLKSEDPDTISSLEKRKVGGLGIFIVKQLSKEIEYSRVDGKNQLKIQILMNSDGESDGSKDNN